jgi:hypothetical protein
MYELVYAYRGSICTRYPSTNRSYWSRWSKAFRPVRTAVRRQLIPEVGVNVIDKCIPTNTPLPPQNKLLLGSGGAQELGTERNKTQEYSVVQKWICLLLGTNSSTHQSGLIIGKSVLAHSLPRATTRATMYVETGIQYLDMYTECQAEPRRF